MRRIVAVLLVLAAVKMGYNEYLFRATSSELIVGTFRADAIAGCQKLATTGALTDPAHWKSPESIRYAVGDTSVPIAFWQVGDPRWHDRHRRPFLILNPAGPVNALTCAFDLERGTARLVTPSRL